MEFMESMENQYVDFSTCRHPKFELSPTNGKIAALYKAKEMSSVDTTSYSYQTQEYRDHTVSYWETTVLII